MNSLNEILRQLNEIRFGCDLEAHDGSICGLCKGDDIRNEIWLQIREIKEFVKGCIQQK